MWLHIPTSACSPEPPASTSPSESLCQALAACCTWRTKQRRPAFWRHALKREALTTRLSGLTCEPSQAHCSVAAWLESLEASPAPTYPSPAGKPESQARKAGSGSSTHRLFARFSPDGCLLKTSLQCSMWETEEPYSENLPAWGSMRNGELYQQQPWEPRISANGYSYWPTARSEDAESCGNHPGATDSLTGAARMWPTPESNESSYSNGMRGQNIREAAAMWPTASAGDGERGSNRRYLHGDVKTGKMLGQEAMMWSTPNVPNGGRTLSEEDILNRGATAKGKRQVGLENEAKLLATPTSAMTTGAGAEGRDGGENLQTMAAAWATPSARDWKSGDASTETLERNARPLNEQAQRDSSPQDQATPAGRLCWCGAPGCGLPSHKRKLNPIFAAWLMDWPIWQCAKEPMPYGLQEMELYLSRQRRCLRSLFGEQEEYEPHR